MKKRILSLLLAMMMVIALVPTAFAAGTGVGLEVTSSANISALQTGDVVTVSITLPEVKNYAGLNIDLTYDNEKFTYNNDASSGVTGANFSTPNESTVRVLDMEDTNTLTLPSGTVALKASFTVKADVDGDATFAIGSKKDLSQYPDGEYLPVNVNTIWPSAETVTIAAAPVITNATVTFKVVNGKWADGTTANKTVNVTLSDGKGTLSASDVPTGMIANANYENGAWDVTPVTTANGITGDVTYTYSFTEHVPVITNATVTFKVVNGKWADGTTANKTVNVTLSDGKGTLSASDVPTGMIANTGYENGSWDVTPVTTANGITGDVTYTYSFVAAAPTTYTVTVNGSYASTTGAGSYEAGETVYIYAGNRDGYSFDGWTSSDVTINNANSKNAYFTMPEGNVTVTANWEYNGGGGGGGGGGREYDIIVEKSAHGTVTPEWESAMKGDTVTLTVKPDKGYKLETLSVAGKGGSVVKVNEKNGVYSFDMPAYAVVVKATFVEENGLVATNPFVDVKSDAYYYDAVMWAVENGITGGKDATHFAPNETCTRAQAVTFLWRAAGSPAPKSTVNPFVDMKPGAYYYDAVLWAVENGITKGTTDTTFSPNATCSRAQIVTFLWRSQKSPAAGTVNPFTDVAAGTYYNNAVLWAVENGITGGTTATTFSPNNNCTRAQIVTFLYRNVNG